MISLRDKLRGFENHPDYPVMKSDIKKKKGLENNLNYNIMTNITLDKHNFLPPENRPFVDHNVRIITYNVSIFT